MHDDDNPRRSLTTHAEDDRDQTAILGVVLEEHPIQLTVAELALQMVGGNPAWADSDAVERGVRELVGMGLLHLSGDTIRPTRSALRFHVLMLDGDSE
ncbi:MAG TPA: hypothetical protein VFL77_05365 [Solirubrobacterales bacterium]|nr:hypothetical protein [Solirubrobacterales bacterium]